MLKTSIIILTIICFSCKSQEAKIKIESLENNFHLVFERKTNSDKLRMIRFPVSFKIVNSTSKEQVFSHFTYIHPERKRGSCGELFINENGKLKPFVIGDEFIVARNSSIDLVLYTVHLPPKDNLESTNIQNFIDTKRQNDKHSIKNIFKEDSIIGNSLYELIKRDTIQIDFDIEVNGRSEWFPVKKPVDSLIEL